MTGPETRIQRNSNTLIETMSVIGMLSRATRKTMKRGLNAVRRVGKVSRNVARKGTNAIGLTRKRRSTKRRR